MIKLLHWFQTNYPEHKKVLLACQHNFDDNDTNPYHVEGDWAEKRVFQEEINLILASYLKLRFLSMLFLDNFRGKR